MSDLSDEYSYRVPPGNDVLSVLTYSFGSLLTYLSTPVRESAEVKTAHSLEGSRPLVGEGCP